MKKPRYGFTFVEAIMVTLIAVVIMFAIQSVFSHAVKSSLKGQDNLATMRAASRIFSELRKDLLQFKSLDISADHAYIYEDEEDIAEDVEYSSILTINKTDETQITYSICDVGDKKYVERVVQELGKSPKRNSFGVPRMKTFEVLYLRVENRVNLRNEQIGQLFVNLVIQSDNPRFPTQKLSVSSSYFPEKLQETNWNFLNL